MVIGEEIKETPQVPVEGLTYPPIAQEAKKCKVCLANTQGNEQKVKKDKMHNIKSACEKCGIQHCRNHLTQMCESCTRKSWTQAEITA